MYVDKETPYISFFNFNGHHLLVYADSDCIFLNRFMVDRAVTAEGVERVYAPPAIVLPQEEQFQIPVATRLTRFFPQKEQM